ncbi:MAG: hypothetical protein A2142_04185 [candidate division Zixibacteria bacterium RBG_16_48_11]|nr:MAG: hypothetical protein A2142_04185 [candidate division Zixibacteria bacterium RBG_16_48_11]
MEYSKENKRKFFFDYFRQRLAFVKEHCTKHNLEAVILSCCALDGLSAYRYGGKSNLKRFLQFVLEYSGLKEDYLKVSLPLLKQDAEKLLGSEANIPNDKKARIERFIEFLENQLGVKDEEYTRLSYDVDMPIESLKNKLWSRQRNGEYDQTLLLIKDILKKELLDYTYIAILWREYRCLAVHESALKRDKAGINLGKKIVPYYVNENIIKSDRIFRSIPRFDIPPQFIISTLENCINNLEKEWEQNNVDPEDFLKKNEALT